MKELIRTVLVQNRGHGRFEEANLFRGVDPETLCSIDSDWLPIFKSTPPGIRIEDAHWDWARKARESLSNPLVYDLFSIEKDGKTQGMMMTAKGGPDCFSRHPEHPQAPIIYVEFIATAPWNRLELAAIYRGVGRALLMTAVNLSHDEGFGGRIGLHSLPGAEAFYRKLSMTDFGNDGPTCHQGLRYFELGTSQARQLIASMTSTEKEGEHETSFQQ